MRESVTVTLNGVEHRLRLTMSALERLMDEHGINALDLPEGSFASPKTVRAMFWACRLDAAPDLAYADADFDVRDLKVVADAIGAVLGGGDDPFGATDSPP